MQTALKKLPIDSLSFGDFSFADGAATVHLNLAIVLGTKGIR